MKSLYTILLTITVTACVTLPKLAGSGNTKTDERTFGTFDAVEISGDLIINLVPGSDGKIKVTADDNIIETVKTALDDETLIVKIDCACKPYPSQAIVIDIPGEALRSVRVADNVRLNIKGLKMSDMEVELSDNAKLRLIDINADQLGVFASDSSEIEASGATNELFIQAEDKAIFTGNELLTESAEISSSDNADVQVNVNNKLEAELSDEAILRLKKQPKESNTQVDDSAVILQQF